jgi:hypothetical protein
MDSKLEGKKLRMNETHIPRIQFAHDFFKNGIHTSKSHSQVFELCHIFEGFIAHVYVMILSFILVTRGECTLRFLSPFQFDLFLYVILNDLDSNCSYNEINFNNFLEISRNYAHGKVP